VRTRLIFAIVLSSLRVRSEPAWLVARISLSKLGFVFCRSPVGSLSPHFEGVRSHLTPHQLDNVAGCQAELVSYRVEAGAIFPRHHDDAVNLASGEFGCFSHGFSLFNFHR